MGPKRRESGVAAAAAATSSPSKSSSTNPSSPLPNAKRRRIGGRASSSYSPSGFSLASQAFTKWEAGLRQHSDALHFPLIRKLYELLYSNRLAEEANKAIKTHLLEVEQLTIARKNKLVGRWISQSDSPQGKLEINEAFLGVVSFPEKGIELATVTGIIENSAGMSVDELKLRIEKEGREGFLQLTLPQNTKSVMRSMKVKKVEEEEEEGELEGRFFLEEETTSLQTSQTDDDSKNNRKTIQFKFSLVRKEYAERIEREEEDLFNELVTSNSFEDEEEDEDYIEVDEDGDGKDDDEDEIDGDVDTTTIVLVSSHLNKLRRASVTTTSTTTQLGNDTSHERNNGDDVLNGKPKKRSKR